MDLQVLWRLQLKQNNLQDGNDRQEREDVNQRLDQLQPSVHAAAKLEIRVLTRRDLVLLLLNFLTEVLLLLSARFPNREAPRQFRQ